MAELPLSLAAIDSSGLGSLNDKIVTFGSTSAALKRDYASRVIVSFGGIVRWSATKGMRAVWPLPICLWL